MPSPDWQASLTPRASAGVDVQNLHPVFAANLVKALDAGPASLTDASRKPFIDSGYRNNADQKAAIEHIWHAKHGAKPVPAKVYKVGIPGLVAGIGRSAHAHGAAVDMPGITQVELQWLRKNGKDYGITPLMGRAQKTDPYHFQAVNAYALPIKDVAHVAVGPRPQEPVHIDAMLIAVPILAAILFLLTRLRPHGSEQADPQKDVPARATRVA